jgi:RNA polymerase sigma-70 factor (ECF subfamily)
MAAAAPASLLDPDAGVDVEVRAAARPPPFEAVYEEHFDFVWRSVQRLGAQPAAVADLVQEVFLNVHRSLPSFEGRSSIKGWLFGIAANVVRRSRRSAQRRRRAVPELDPPVDPDAFVDARRPGPADSAERAEAVRVLYALLDALEEGQREVFVMAELEQMTAPEISEALGVNVHTVYSKLRAARASFEKAVSLYRARSGRRVR